MKKTFKPIVASLGLVAVTFVQREVKAQKVKSLNEVVISATKNDQKQSQTGKVISVIDSLQLAQSSGRTVAEFLNQQVGLQILGSGNNIGKDKSVFFRGAASANAVVLIDGVLASDPSSIGSAFDLRLLAVDQVERIEVLRGGQSTLYGSDAIAGVINIVTKKKVAKGNHMYGSISAGSYNTYKGTLGLNSKVDAFSYNLSYSHLKTNGISEAQVPEGNTLVFDRDGSKQDALNANFGIQIAPRFMVNPFLRYTHLQFDYDNSAFADANNNGVSKNFNGGTNAVYSLNSGKITFNYSYQTTARSFNDAYPRQLKGNMNVLDLFYNQSLGNKVDLLLGVDQRKTTVSYYNSTGVSKPNISLLSAYTSIYLHNLSVFNLEIGGRYNKHRNYGYKENFTYSITPSIVLNQHVKFFGTASSAFRAPALDMLFGTWGANPNLKPEISNQLEAGLATTLFNEQFKLHIVAFKRDITDAIFYGSNGYINQDEQKDKGIEIEPSLVLGKLNLNAFYTYTKGKTKSNNIVDYFLLRRPKHMIGANAGLQLTKPWFISIQYKFTGKRVDNFYDSSNWTTVRKDLKAYQLLDFYTEYAFANRKLKLFADIKNITNQQYTEIVGFATMGTNVNAGLSFSF